MAIIVLAESGEIPITEGTIQVDTSKGSVTLMLRPGSGKELTIKKISHDANIVAVYFPDGLVGTGEILIFGLPAHARIHKGKAMTVVLCGGMDHWKVVRTY